MDQQILSQLNREEAFKLLDNFEEKLYYNLRDQVASLPKAGTELTLNQLRFVYAGGYYKWGVSK